ncbi:hypothetical protein CEXT_418291 [Caerostris extrusa]|uniref:Uncharacterized protein n=1 Tax=Caerostris extrusa TaxID=172846 RepID=A0AAV4MVN2_CAEEX|nr:hypothetical protein CEXT_418291 [Caerostris extrusa]
MPKVVNNSIVVINNVVSNNIVVNVDNVISHNIVVYVNNVVGNIVNIPAVIPCSAEGIPPQHFSLAVGQDRKGPVFTIEPPNRVEFSNTTGAVIPCSAEGDPTTNHPMGPCPGWQLHFRHSRTPACSAGRITDVPTFQSGRSKA